MKYWNEDLKQQEHTERLRSDPRRLVTYVVRTGRNELMRHTRKSQRSSLPALNWVAHVSIRLSESQCLHSRLIVYEATHEIGVICWTAEFWREKSSNSVHTHIAYESAFTDLQRSRTVRGQLRLWFGLSQVLHRVSVIMFQRQSVRLSVTSNPWAHASFVWLDVPVYRTFAMCIYIFFTLNRWTAVRN